MTDTTAPLSPLSTVDLAVGGMTCASCVARVEKKLSKLDGVTATVNLATESAHLTLTAEVSDDDLVATVVRAGYTARVLSRHDLATPASHASQSPQAVVTQKTEAPLPQQSTAQPSIGTSHLTRSRQLRTRALVSLALSIPLMALSMISAWQFPGWQWVAALLALPVATWGAWPFHSAAARAIRHGSFTMDTLVSLGVIAASALSLWALFWGGAGAWGAHMDMALIPRQHGHGARTAHLYFESAAWVTTFLLLGRWAEARAKYRSGDALRSLLSLGATQVTRVTLTSPSGSRDAIDVLDDDGTPLSQASRSTEIISVEDVRVGDLFSVRPGETIATDGVVVEGRSSVDASMLTGESVPVDVEAGTEVTGATINLSGAVLVRATRVGEGTTLARIGALVTAAQAGKAPIQRLADKVSGIFVPAVITLAVATVVAWLACGAALEPALLAGVSVLVIACPCALGLATPTAILVGSGQAAQRGIVIAGPQILESTRALDTIVLDKTGTVTTGQMNVDPESGVIPVRGSRAHVLALAGAVEAPSEHPVAQAITRLAQQETRLAHMEDFLSHEGRGVSGTVTWAGQRMDVAVGRPTWLATLGRSLPAEVDDVVAACERNGATTVVLHAQPHSTDGTQRPLSEPASPSDLVVGVVAARDTVRASSAEAVARLQRMGVRPLLVTGDHARVAAAVAAQVGIATEDVRAGVLPGDKRDIVADLQQRGFVVGMVGDGVNDAAALAQAGVRGLGFAMGTGTDVAREAADITLMRADLMAVVDALVLSRQTLRIIKQNLWWAFAYNVAALPVAAAGLLNPMIAGGAMACSSVIVVLNSLRLRHAGLRS